ncbi:hypothetical protein LXL04_008555 [Taraxacum kok-saghyz]
MRKVRIIRLWKLTKFSNSNNVYEINLILMDEDGGKIQCNVEVAFIPILGKLLEEYATVFIERPTIGLNVGSLKNVDNEHRLYSTIQLRLPDALIFLALCMGFHLHHTMILLITQCQKIQSSVNIIGDVVNLFKDNNTNPTVHKKLKINLEVQDAEGNKIFVTLWEGRPYVNNTYRSSKLFINDNIDDIVTFKRKKKVQVVKATNDEQGEVVQKEETEVFWCSECQNNVVSASPREVSEILNITGKENVNTSEYPAELTDLIDKKFAFKLVVAKLTPDTRIISQLEIIEKKLTTEQDDTSETGDNSTPISNNIKNNHLNTPGPNLNTNTLIPVLNELKRKPVDVYDVDAPESESATRTYVKSNSGVPIKLLIPKIEK